MGERNLSDEELAAAQHAAVAAEVLRPESAPVGPGQTRDALRGDGVRPAQPRDARPGRVESYDVADFPVPNGREEEWRFTPLRRMRGLHKGDVEADGTVLVEVEATATVGVETVDRDDPRLGRAYVPTDRVSAQAYTGFTRATVVSVPAEAKPDRPIVVNQRGKGGTAFGHLQIEVGELAEAIVVLDHSGSVSFADNVEYILGDGASLYVVSVQDWDDDTVHASHHHARLGRDARFRSFVVTLGGDLVRLCPSVRYEGPGGDAELLGLFFVDAPQHLEHRLVVDHAVENCRSRVNYKGALQGKGAQSVWVGDVIIRPNAVGTDTYESNRNLQMTDGARAISVPNLEIEIGDVSQAGHASATGRFDEDQLFYLMSRGIPDVEARKLVVRGFFGELIQQLEIPELRDRVTAEIEQELEQIKEEER